MKYSGFICIVSTAPYHCKDQDHWPWIAFLVIFVIGSLVDLAGVGVRVGEGGLAVGADALRQAVLRVEVEHLEDENESVALG